MSWEERTSGVAITAPTGSRSPRPWEHRPPTPPFPGPLQLWLHILAPGAAAQQWHCQPLLAGKPSRFPFCSLCLLLLWSGPGSLLRAASRPPPGSPASCRLCGPPSNHCPHSVPMAPRPDLQAGVTLLQANEQHQLLTPRSGPAYGSSIRVSCSYATARSGPVALPLCRVAPCAAPKPEAPSDGQATPSMASLNTPVASPAWETWRHPDHAPGTCPNLPESLSQPPCTPLCVGLCVNRVRL